MLKLLTRFLLSFILFLSLQGYAAAQLFEGDAGGGDAYVNEYTATGQPIATPDISVGYAAGDLEGIAISGNDLFTADRYSGTVGEYNWTTGQAINSSFISLPFAGSFGITVSNNILYVTNNGTLYAFSISGTPTALWTDYIGASGGVAVSGSNVFAITNEDGIGEYNALTGAVESANLVTGLYDTFGLTVSGNDLYTSSYGGGTVSEFTTSGQTVNATLISGIPDGANGLAVGGNMLYVADIDQVQEYNATTGSYVRTINSGMEQANSVAFVAPEPSTWTLLWSGLSLLTFWRLRTRRTVS